MFTTIRNKIIVNIIAISVAVSLVFVMIGLLVSYYVEDAMFTRQLNDEKVKVESQLVRGQIPTTGIPYIKYYPNKGELPKPILTLLAQEPQRIEFPGDNSQHYHLLEIKNGYLVAEVSDYLIVRQIKQGIAYLVVQVLVVILLLVGFIAWRIARRIVKPIDKLTSILNSMDQNALPQGFAKEFDNDEMGLFAQKLDQTMTRLDKFIKREQDFTRDVSHELRTPVAINQGAVSLLKQTQLSEQQQQLVTRIDQANSQMHDCIEGLLTLAREGEFNTETVKLLPLIEQAVIEHHELLDSNRAKPELQLNVSSELSFQSNPKALSIIINNLIANAFSHSDGDIDISNDEAELIITNPTKNMASQHPNDLFNKGVKSDDSGGLGLGLSIVERLCTQLNLAISISHENGEIKVVLKSNETRSENGYACDNVTP
ncbi:HAMP domain-containing sensor histidine kinase [Paraferrimonas sp. SM1919]|uniref:sensor histidine kinase n=1 Tax=Paraferrimonas sp. SM1919 TaxID=2662263 RepID=UPI0013D0242E|nr:HAMP domain-containing sensor histidine kinase [Paraferrimonas sp. SM1919]